MKCKTFMQLLLLVVGIVMPLAPLAASQQQDLARNTRPLANSTRIVRKREGIEQINDWLKHLHFALRTAKREKEEQQKRDIRDIKPTDESTLRRQQFILDVVMSANGVVPNEDAVEFVANEQDLFNHIDDTMLHYLKLYVDGEVLPKSESLVLLDAEHLRQMVGLYRLMVHAKTWQTFKSVVCAARRKVNDALVINALAMAMPERADTRTLILPPIYEILPQLFYSKAFVQQVRRYVDFNDLMSDSVGDGEGEELTLPSGLKIWYDWRDERSSPPGPGKIIFWQSDIDAGADDERIYRQQQQQLTLDERIAYLTDDLSLSNLWYAANIRSALTLGESVIANSNKNNKNNNNNRYTSTTRTQEGNDDDDDGNDRLLHVSRRRLYKATANRLANNGTTSSKQQQQTPAVVHAATASNNEDEFYEELTAVISGEDVLEEAEPEEGRQQDNAATTRWTPTLLAHDDITHNAAASDGINMDIRYLRNGEIFLQTLQQLWARVNLEKISHVAQDYYAQIRTNEISSMKDTYAEYWENRGRVNRNVDFVRMLNERDRLADASVARALPAIQRQLHDSVLLMLRELIALRAESRPMHLVNGRVRELIGNILLGHRFSEYQGVDVDAIALWRGIEHQLNAALSAGDALALSEMEHHVMNPITRRLIDLVVRVTESISERLPAHTTDRMRLEGVRVHTVQVPFSFLTYWDSIDRDIFKLLPDIDAQRRTNDVPKWHKMLVARQRRLYSRDFAINFYVMSEHSMDVVVRVLLGPQLNVSANLMDLNDIRQQYMLIDAFATRLREGNNFFTRESPYLPSTSRDVTPLTQLYKLVLLGIDGVQPVPIDSMHSRNCRMPNRLLLPRGLPDGLPLQLLIVVTERTALDMTLPERLRDDLVCGIGTMTMNLDMLPFNYPLDRRIENLQDLLALPNIHLKDVQIYR